MHDARSVPHEGAGHDRPWWAPGVDRALEDRALKRALERGLADRLRRAGLAQGELREGLAPALGFRQQLERVRRYHLGRAGAEEAGARR